VKGSDRRVYTQADRNEALLVLQKGGFMKTIFNSNNRGKSTLYILFAVAVLSFAALLLLPLLLGVDISPLALLFALMCIMFLGGILIQMRSGSPW
jgi:hypothetical protein